MARKKAGFASYVPGLSEDPALCDVTIVVDSDTSSAGGTVSVQAHRVVLATMSDYFRTMFYGQFIEANRSEVRLFGVSHSTFQQCLRFMYCGWDDTLETMSLDEGIKFYSQARMLLMDTKLKNSYSEWIAENIMKWEKQLWKLFAMAIEFNLQLIVNRCEELFSDVANEYLVFDAFLTAPLAVVQKVLSCEAMNCSKKALIRAIQRWISSNKMDNHVKKDVLKSVRSKKAPFFKGQEANFYNKFKVKPQKQGQFDTDSSESASSRHCYSSKLYFRKCVMLFGVTVVFERNPNSNSNQIEKGDIDVKVEIKEDVKFARQDVTRTAVVSYDLSRSTSQKINIFFPAIKCCGDSVIRFTFSWTAEGVQPLMHTFGEIDHDLVKTKKSLVVGIYQRLVSVTGDNYCAFCQARFQLDLDNPLPPINDADEDLDIWSDSFAESYDDGQDTSSELSNWSDSFNESADDVEDMNSISEHSFRSESDDEQMNSEHSYRNDSFNDDDDDDLSSGHSFRNESDDDVEDRNSAHSFQNDSFNQSQHEDEDMTDEQSFRNNDSFNESINDVEEMNSEHSYHNDSFSESRDNGEDVDSEPSVWNDEFNESADNVEDPSSEHSYRNVSDEDIGNYRDDASNVSSSCQDVDGEDSFGNRSEYDDVHQDRMNEHSFRNHSFDGSIDNVNDDNSGYSSRDESFYGSYDDDNMNSDYS